MDSARSAPRLARIILYPVKSLDGVEVDSAMLLPSGALEHDRQLAIIDAHGRVKNGKRDPRFHRLRASLSPDLAVLTLTTDGAADSAPFELATSAGQEGLARWLSEFFGEPLMLIENVEAGFPDDTEAAGPTILSTATLEEVARWFGLETAEARRRFRANLEIDGVEAFWEDRLHAKAGSVVQFRVGEASLEGVRPCARCVVPTRDSQTGEVMRGFAARLAEQREATLPEWTRAAYFDHFYRLSVNTRVAVGAPRQPLRTGDPIEIGRTVAL